MGTKKMGTITLSVLMVMGVFWSYHAAWGGESWIENLQQYMNQYPSALQDDFQIETSGFIAGMNTINVRSMFPLYGELSVRKLNAHLKYLERIYPRRDWDLPDHIAERMITTAQCFGLDANVFAAMVQMESTFDEDAVSPTGATGLTQFTVSGLMEVNDQLGIPQHLRPRKIQASQQSIPEATEAFNFIIDRCIEPYLLKGARWQHLWERRWVRNDLSKMKQELVRDIDASLVYGAVLLKTYLAAMRETLGFKEMDSTRMFRLYFNALAQYNGEPDRKRYYATTVLKYARQISVQRF